MPMPFPYIALFLLPRILLQFSHHFSQWQTLLFNTDIYDIMHKYCLISTWQKLEMYEPDLTINIPSFFSQVSYPRCSFHFTLEA